MYHSLVYWNNHLVAFGGYKLVQENYQYPIGFVYDKILAIDLTTEERGSLSYSWTSNCVDAEKYGITVRMAHTAIMENDTMYMYGGRSVLYGTSLAFIHNLTMITLRPGFARYVQTFSPQTCLRLTYARRMVTPVQPRLLKFST